MKRAIYSLILLAVTAAGCTADRITEVDGGETDPGISVSCTALNADLVALQALVKAIGSGGTVTSVSGSTLVFSGGETVTVPVRDAYDFSYVNPVVGLSDGIYWTLDGKALPSGGSALRVADGLLQLKGAANLWYAYYDGEWNEVGSIASGSSIPVFKAFDSTGDAVQVTLSDGTVLNAQMYKGTEAISVSSSSVSIAKEGGVATVSVTANAAWTASCEADWLSLSPASGAASDAAPVTLTAAENTGAARKATVVFSTGELSATVTVSQAGNGGTIDTGDTEISDDNIARTEFARTVTVTYSTGGHAVVGGTTDDFTVTVSGNDVTITYKGTENILYELSGTTDDGFFKLYSAKKQAIRLAGVSITNKNGAAINNQSKKRTFVVVEGTNTLSDGTSYTETPENEDEKAAFFSEGQLIFSGGGSLTVTARGKAGITSDDYVRFMSSPTVKVSSSVGHGIRGKDYILVSNGTVEATVSAAMKKGFSSDSLVRFDGGVTTISVSGGSAYDSEDGDYSGSAGIKADQLFEMTGGTVTITNTGQGGKGIKVGGSPDVTVTSSNYNAYAIGKSYISGGRLTIKTTGGRYTQGDISPKGIKVGWAIKSGHAYSYYSGDLEIRGGVVSVTAESAEAIECKRHLTVKGGEVYAYSKSDDAINAAGDFTVEDGFLCGISSGNDGLDANGNFYLKGGVVYAVGAGTPEMGIDANSEGGFKAYLTGGTLFAIGGLEKGASLSQACYSASSWSKNTWYGLTVGSSSYAFRTPSSGGTGIVVSGASTPTLLSGVTVSGGTTLFDGNGYVGGFTGGTSVSLGNYTAGSGGGPGGGGHGRS